LQLFHSACPDRVADAPDLWTAPNTPPIFY
jgi:hypothetical protein